MDIAPRMDGLSWIQTRCEAVIGVQIGVIDRGVKTRVGLIYLDKGALA